MRPTFTLGRLFGVRVGVNWSVLAVFAYIAWALAADVLPTDQPGHRTGVYWAFGTATALLFFLSLLAHEVAHALVARRAGLTVSGITLWLLGGVSHIEGEPAGPAAEARIAGAGPLTSLALALVAGTAAAVLAGAGASGVLVDSAAWLGGVNLLLAVFNSLPAAPLDGGRLLRALVWWRTGDRARATAVASTAGRAFGWTLVVAGGTLLVATGSLGWLWFPLVGWFLVAAATAEGQQSRTHDLLSGITAGQIMTADPVCAPASLTVARFLESDLFRLRHSAFPLTIGEPTPVGLVTLERIRRVPPGAREETRLRDVMYPLEQIAVTGPDQPAADLVPLAGASPSHRVLVLDQGRLVGLVSPSDVNRALRWALAGGH